MAVGDLRTSRVLLGNIEDVGPIQSSDVGLGVVLCDGDPEHTVPRGDVQHPQRLLPIPAHKHGVAEVVIDGQTVDAAYVMAATVPLNVTGLPGLSMRFGTSKEGLPINVQLVGSWFAEPTLLHLASLLESVSSVRNLHPSL